MSPKAVSYIGIGGSDWGTHVQSEHQLQAMTPSWQVIDNEWVPWSKTALMDDALIDRATQIGENLAAAAKKIQENVAAGTDPSSTSRRPPFATPPLPGAPTRSAALWSATSAAESA